MSLDVQKPKMSPAQALTIFGLIPVSMIIRGLVFSILWTWFVVPLGVMSIGIAHAIGISSTVGFLTMHLSNSKIKNSDNPFGDALGQMLFTPFLVLFLAWIIHLFM
jgi:hypothetical protein